MTLLLATETTAKVFLGQRKETSVNEHNNVLIMTNYTHHLARPSDARVSSKSRARRRRRTSTFFEEQCFFDAERNAIKSVVLSCRLVDSNRGQSIEPKRKTSRAAQIAELCWRFSRGPYYFYFFVHLVQLRYIFAADVTS